MSADFPLPVNGRQNVLITSALPFVSYIPHLGNIIEGVLSADMFARYCRNRGYNVVYICGTNEYGISTELKALEEEGSEEDICLNGLLHGQVCSHTPCSRKSKHLFLALPSLKDEKSITEKLKAGECSQNASQFTEAWLKEGLKQHCITRDFKWGVPVKGGRVGEKVFSAWFDAPIGYISITAVRSPKWAMWWQNPENVELYQFMGKDDVPFHTVMFPSTLLGTRENWIMMKTISATDYLYYEEGKFSMSKGVGVFGDKVKDTKFPVEVWIYYLLANRHEASDTVFTWVDLQAKLKIELLNNLGNFINRVLSFIAKDPGSGYGSLIPDVEDADADSHPQTKDLGEKVGYLVKQYIESMEKVKLKEGLAIAMSISCEGNAYLKSNEEVESFKKQFAGDPTKKIPKKLTFVDSV